MLYNLTLVEHIDFAGILDCREAVSNGDTFFLLRLGKGASAGMFHVFPVRKAPSIFPVAQ